MTLCTVFALNMFAVTLLLRFATFHFSGRIGNRFSIWIGIDVSFVVTLHAPSTNTQGSGKTVLMLAWYFEPSLLDTDKHWQTFTEVTWMPWGIRPGFPATYLRSLRLDLSGRLILVCCDITIISAARYKLDYFPCNFFAGISCNLRWICSMILKILCVGSSIVTTTDSLTGELRSPLVNLQTLHFITHIFWLLACEVIICTSNTVWTCYAHRCRQTSTWDFQHLIIGTRW